MRLVKKCATAAQVVVVALLVASCSYTTAVPVSPGSTDVRGLRVYDPKPILVISGANAAIMFIPNYERGYAIRYASFLAYNEIHMSLSGGMLVQIDNTLDSTSFISFLENIGQEALNQLAGQTTTLSGDRDKGKDRILISIYEFCFGDEGEFQGLVQILDPDGTPHPSTCN